MSRATASFAETSSAGGSFMATLQTSRGNQSIAINAAADFMGPGTIEINRYQTEIVDMVRRRFPFGQRINNVPATGQPSRYFEQILIPSAAFSDPRSLAVTPSQPQRVERPLMLKALTAGINYGIFDVEVNQQQGVFTSLEAKDLTDTVDAVLKLHDQNLWQGNDTSTVFSTSLQYYGISGQIFNAATGTVIPGNGILAIGATGSLVDSMKSLAAKMTSRQDFEASPTALYANSTTLDLFDKEAKAIQLTFNEVEVIPGVIVQAIPTQAGLVPLIQDASITNVPGAGGTTAYTCLLLNEKMAEYHYLTDPLPRVFQLGLLANLAAQYVVVKFGAPVLKGAPYVSAALVITR